MGAIGSATIGGATIGGTPERDEIPVVQLDEEGVSPGLQQEGDPIVGHYIADNTGRTVLEVVNSDSSSHSVTVETPLVIEEVNVEEIVVSIPPGATRLLGPFTPKVYNQADGSVFVDVSDRHLLMRAYRVVAPVA